MPISFAEIKVGQAYSRNALAEFWGYSSMHAIARGVVTPKDDNKIILFVTHDKQKDAEQYEDELVGSELRWEGPTDHFAEERMLNATENGDEIHLFYRDRHHADFVYHGKLAIIGCERHADHPSKFLFSVVGAL